MRDPQALISTKQLAGCLGDPDLRVYDCTTCLEPPPSGSPDPYIAVPGRAIFEAAHIPGADFSTCKASSPISRHGCVS